MVLAMPDFHEVELLAAQAWNAAGETRNALPFARDLATNPRIPEELRAAAEVLLRSPRVPVDAPMGERDFEQTEGPESCDPYRSAAPAPLRSRQAPTALPPPMKSRSERPPPEPAILVLPDSSPSPVARSVPPPQVVVHDSRVGPPALADAERPPPAPANAAAPAHA